MSYIDTPVPIHLYIGLGTVLFCIGLFGVLARRNAIAILMALELMFNACNIVLVAFCQRHGITFTLQAFSRAQDIESPVGQIFAIFVITIAAAEAAVGLALAIAAYRHFKSINMDDINLLKW
ncbi:MAG TPA: NADH-quinone oxidoreductase subunit NuoK [bacterium]|jgi:NADH-quinone oxidoreductase subunit K